MMTIRWNYFIDCVLNNFYYGYQSLNNNILTITYFIIVASIKIEQKTVRIHHYEILNVIRFII